MELKKSYWSFDLCLFLSSTQDWTFILEYYANQNIQQDEKVSGDGMEGGGYTSVAVMSCGHSCG